MDLAQREAEITVEGLVGQYGEDDESDDQQFECRLEFELPDTLAEGLQLGVLRQNRQGYDGQRDGDNQQIFHHQDAEEEGQDGGRFRGDAGVLVALPAVIRPESGYQKCQEAGKAGNQQPVGIELLGGERTDATQQGE